MALIPFICIMILAVAFPESFRQITNSIRDFLGIHFGWFYLMVVFLCVVISVIVIFHPMGKIRLGDPNSKPEYSTFSWIAMLFSAGMGIGLVFYGAAEPLSHYAVMAPETTVFTQQAMLDALKYSFFHYGISAWAVYGMVALAIAYFKYRKKEVPNISSTLKPIFGKYTEGNIGYVVDALTIFATVVGVATSLGLGAVQINSGLNYLFGITQSINVQIIIIIIASILFLTSAVSGINKGVRILSNTNILLAILLMLIAFVIGPSLDIANFFIESIGAYMNDFIRMSFRTAASGTVAQQGWVQSWTIYYWAWWISWSPFVGVFIANISKGRTIREFLTYILLVPSIFSFVWFSIFGTLAMNGTTPGSPIIKMPISNMLFGIFNQYPLAIILSILAIILIIIYFITSADSATVVLAILSENGNEETSKKIKVIWGIILSSTATILLINGGLDGLQNILIITAFPFSIILMLIVVSVFKELVYEKDEMRLFVKAERHPTVDRPFKSYENQNKEDEE
ncbi:BCCT family transporter [Methanobrevibacter sp. A27]|uniref:BCCT family transporter n=1 Tax=Methanobrevibacter sp. A27 TaxID=1860099 RepID=UPI0021018541|nr:MULTISPECIES: BCCT family transporter [Methanobrevibacter]